MDVGHKKKSFFAYEHKIVDDKITAKELNKHQTLLNEYKKRVVKLVKSSRSFGIEPILLTQPTLVGKGKDPITNINLETIEWIKWNGKTYWSMLEKYNKITKEVGTELNVKTIDLAHKLPKNSIYFYDFIHFTNAGSEKVSEILATELIPFLQQQGH